MAVTTRMEEVRNEISDLAAVIALTPKTSCERW